MIVLTELAYSLFIQYKLAIKNQEVCDGINW